MVIQSNISSMNTQFNNRDNVSKMAKSLEKLASGKAINRAGDNAAGLAVSVRMRAQINSLGQASKNAQDAISLLQTAEGAMGETHSLLEMMRKMSVVAANASYADVIDRAALQLEFAQFMEEIDYIAENTDFNNIFLLNGELAKTDTEDTGIDFQLSANSGGADYRINIGDMSVEALGIDDLDVTTQENANKAIDKISNAMDKVSTARAECGVMMNRIQYTNDRIDVVRENLSAAESRITDTDMASEMMKFTKFEILTDSSRAMMAQANAQPASVLGILSKPVNNTKAVKADAEPEKVKAPEPKEKKIQGS